MGRFLSAYCWIVSRNSVSTYILIFSAISYPFVWSIIAISAFLNYKLEEQF